MHARRESATDRKRRNGYSIAELPAGMIFLFVGVAIPLIVLSSITYRGLFLYFATRDSCIRAAKAPTYSEAQTRASASFTRSVAGFTEISGTQTLRIVIKPLAGGPSTVRTGPLALGSVNTSNNVYFIRELVNGTVAPLLGMNGKYFGLNIPGLTSSFNLSLRYDALVENPDGLTE
jgi:hypothetical protein